MAIMPRVVGKDPWDLIQAFLETQSKETAAQNADARRLERMPIEVEAQERLNRSKAELGLEMLPRELAAREPFDIRKETRGTDQAIRRDSATTDNNIRQNRATTLGNLEAHEEFYKKSPTFYETFRRGRAKVTGDPDDDLPALGEGEGRVTVPSDMTQSMTIDDLKRQYDIVGMPYTYKGKNYVTIKPKGGGPIQSKEIGPPATGKGDSSRVPQRDVPPLRMQGGPSPRPTEELLQQVPGVGQPSQGPIGRQSGLLGDTVNAFVKAGFSVEGAKALAAEGGREHSYRPELIFGSHSDPHNAATNVGVFSWQGDRRTAVMERLREEGLLDEAGKVIPSQDALDVMAEFTRDEMGRMNPKLLSYLRGEQVDPEVAAKRLGRRYIKWRYDDPRYASHHNNRREWGNRAGQLLNRPQVRATVDPDIFDVLTEDDMRTVG